MATGQSVFTCSKSVGRVQQRSIVQRPALGNTFMMGSSANFAGQSLRVEATNMAGSRKITAMAAKGEQLHAMVAFLESAQT